jgi:hypothetical protein
VVVAVVMGSASMWCLCKMHPVCACACRRLFNRTRHTSALAHLHFAHFATLCWHTAWVTLRIVLLGRVFLPAVKWGCGLV